MNSKKILILTIFIFLSFFIVKPVYSEDVILLDKTNVQENVVENSEEENPDVVKTTPKTANIIEQSASWPYQNNLQESVSPQPKQELFRVLMSFMKVMFGVVICSIIIFFLALFTKKFYGIPNTQGAQNTSETLRTPNNEDEALKNFLDKTK